MNSFYKHPALFLFPAKPQIDLTISVWPACKTPEITVYSAQCFLTWLIHSTRGFVSLKVSCEAFNMTFLPMEQILVSHPSDSFIGETCLQQSAHYNHCNYTFGVCAGLMGGHQSSFDPPPEGSAKCSLDLGALLHSPVVQRLHLSPPTTVAQSCAYLQSEHFA